MITVGTILAKIRRQKDFQQNALHAAVKDLCNIGPLRDIEAGRTKYIQPILLARWMEWLELSTEECEFLVQENIRCLCRDQLKDIPALKVRPQLLGAIADTIALLTRSRPIEVTKVCAELTKHNLPFLLVRPPYIDSIITSINKENHE